MDPLHIFLQSQPSSPSSSSSRSSTPLYESTHLPVEQVRKRHLDNQTETQTEKIHYKKTRLALNINEIPFHMPPEWKDKPADIALLLDHWRMLRVHSEVLEDSEYFSSLINSNNSFNKFKKTFFCLNDVDPHIAIQVVEYLYTGEIYLTYSNLAKIADLAHKWEIRLLLDHCKLFLREQASLEEALSLWYGRRKTPLDDEIFFFAAINAQSLLYTQQFADLPAERVFQLLNSPDLNVSSPEEAFQLLMHWGSSNCPDELSVSEFLQSFIFNGSKLVDTIWCFRRQLTLYYPVYENEMLEYSKHNGILHKDGTTFWHISLNEDIKKKLYSGIKIQSPLISYVPDDPDLSEQCYWCGLQIAQETNGTLTLYMSVESDEITKTVSKNDSSEDANREILIFFELLNKFDRRRHIRTVVKETIAEGFPKIGNVEKNDYCLARPMISLDNLLDPKKGWIQNDSITVKLACTFFESI